MRNGNNIGTLHELILNFVIFACLNEFSSLISLVFSMPACDSKGLIVCCAKSDSYYWVNR